MAYVDDTDTDLNNAGGGLAGLLPYGKGVFLLHVRRVYFYKGFKGRAYRSSGTVIESDRADVPVGSVFATHDKIDPDPQKRDKKLGNFASMVRAVANMGPEDNINQKKNELLELGLDEDCDLGVLVRCVQTENPDATGKKDDKGNVIKYTNRQFTYVGEAS